jgi:hypothetical protein
LLSGRNRQIFHILEYGMPVELKPQDLLVMLKQAAHPQRVWTYATLGEALMMSASQVHRSVQRSLAAGLATSKARGEWQTVRAALVEFAVHGVRYAFPATLGAPRRGIPTSFGAPPLAAHISSAPGEAPVWAHPLGESKGPSLSPISRNAPDAALADPTLHRLLALLDALRTGRARERSLAKQLFGEALDEADAK